MTKKEKVGVIVENKSTETCEGSMNPIVSTATESTLTLGARPVNRHWGYFCNYNDKVQEVSRYVEMLDGARKRVQNEVMAAELNAEEIEDDVQHWLKRVDEKIKEYESFLSDGRREKTKCSFGYSPNNLRLRYWLGRKATKIVEEINADGLLKKNFDKVSYRVSPSLELAFPELESMCLYKLENLEKICDSQLTEPSFCNLKIIKIKACHQLKYLLPYATVRLLTMLEAIEVCDCDSLKEIFSFERQSHTINDDNIVFPQLRALTLQSLPAFTCLYNSDNPGAQSLEDHVPNTNMEARISLFDEKVSVPKLERLELSSINIQKICSDQSLPCFQNLLTLKVTDCGKLKYLLSFSMAGSLVNLQRLSINACEMMEDIFCRYDFSKNNIDIFPKLKTMEIICMERLNTIWQPQIGVHSFRNLDSLIIRECHKLVTIFPSYLGQRIQRLQSLIITNCKLVKSIFHLGNITQTYVKNETKLRKVTLEELPNLVHVWKNDTSEVLKYNNLRSIDVNMCSNVKYLFPLSLASDLEKLEILNVRMCKGMKEIFAGDNDSNENVITFKFPHLNTLSFSGLSELGSFYRGTHTLEWPSLKKFWVSHCYKLEGFTTEITNSQVKPIVLATEKVMNNLESITVSLKEAECLQKHFVRMPKLEELMFWGLNNPEILYWFLQRLPSLKKLRLGMSHIKRIWAPGSLISDENIGAVMQLKELELLSLFHLVETGFEHDQLLQRVERLLIKECMTLTNIASSSVSFSYLTGLEVTNCRLMRYLMACSTAKSLVQLTSMKVSSCPKIVEIVAEKEEEKAQEIEFRELKSLELISLQNLTSFCSSNKCDLKFPLLENLVVSECPQMTKFTDVHNVPNLQKVYVLAGEKDKWYWEGDLNHTLQKHFTNQVSLEYSEQMRLIDYPEMNVVRHGKPAFSDNLFGSLKKLEFDGACKREIVIPSHALAYFKNLEELNVHNCEAAQLIFGFDDKEGKSKGIVLRLKILTLKWLPNLKCVWNKNLHGIVSFPNLQIVEVFDCKCIVTLFPSSIARNLEKLKTLEIWQCDKLVEIVGKEDEIMELETSQILLEFPCLLKLILYKLPVLSWFYPGKHHLECPLLETLHVVYCPKLKVFTSAFHDSRKGVIEGQKSLFLVEKVVPQLKRLTVNEETIRLLSNGLWPQHLLSRLHYLELRSENYVNEKETLPFDFLQRIPNLEHLEVSECFGLKEIFPSKKLQFHEEILVGLKQLTLFKLINLKSIGLEYPWVKLNSENLVKLRISRCPGLKTLGCGAVSFINLKRLIVESCERMEYLFTFSTAKTLVQLEMLHIENCKSMTEIVKKEDEDASHYEIIFGELINIELNSLPRLVSFYPGNATLRFSCLKTARVYKCINMETFSEGVIDMPMFIGIQASMEDHDFVLYEDVNITMKTLFLLQIYLKYTKDIQLEDYPEMRVWHGKLVFPESFGSIKKLYIKSSFKRCIVIPSYVLPFFKCLEELHVQDCTAEVIFDIDDSETKTKQNIVSPLKILTLVRLSNLKCVWNKDPRGMVRFPNLQEVGVYYCGSLATMFPSSIARDLGKLQTLYIFRCEKLVEIFDIDDSETKTKQISFMNLKYLWLVNCERMEYLFTFSTAKSLEQLEILDIEDCESIKEIVKKEDEDDSHDIIFGSLTTLILVSLPELVRFYSGNATLQFSCLQTATVAQCPYMETFSQGAIHAPLFHGIQTSLEDYHHLTFHLDLNSTIQKLFH